MNTNKLVFLLTVAIAVAAWLTYAEHPTGRNLRAAIIDTLGLI